MFGHSAVFIIDRVAFLSDLQTSRFSWPDFGAGFVRSWDVAAGQNIAIYSSAVMDRNEITAYRAIGKDLHPGEK